MAKVPRYGLERLKEQFSAPGTPKEYFLTEFNSSRFLPTEPYRTESYGIGILKEGDIRLRSGLIELHPKAPAIMAMGPGVIRRWLKGEGEPNTETLFFLDSFLLKSHTNPFFLRQLSFFEKPESHILSLTEGQVGHFLGYFQEIRQLIESQRLYQDDLIRHRIFLLLYEIEALHLEQIPPLASRSRSEQLFNQFQELLRNSPGRRRFLADFAEQLFVSPKHLSETVREVSGKTAGEWIDEALLLEAQVLLQNPALSIAQIADQLDFPDQSTFGKFFKRLSGVSPKVYRR